MIEEREREQIKVEMEIILGTNRRFHSGSSSLFSTIMIISEREVGGGNERWKEGEGKG